MFQMKKLKPPRLRRLFQDKRTGVIVTPDEFESEYGMNRSRYEEVLDFEAKIPKFDPIDTSKPTVTFEDTVRAGMNVITGDEFKKNFVAVASMASENLSKTLGPYAHTTLIDDGASIYPTKDGWNIINRLQFGDGIQNSLYGMMKDVAFHLVTTVGDGTTTALVASNAMIQLMNNEEYKSLIQKSRQRDFLESMSRVKDAIQRRLESPKYIHFVKPDNHYEDIYKIAMISSNENEEISEIIRKIYDETGNPNIHVNLGSGKKTDYEIQVGYRLDCKPLGLKSFVNYEGDLFKGRDILTLFINHNVTYAEHLELVRALMEIGSEKGIQILVFAPYFDDIVTGAIAQDSAMYIRAGKLPSVFPIQIPVTREVQKYFFEDAAMITKSLIFKGENLKEILDIAHPRDEEGKPLALDNGMRALIIKQIKDKLESFLGVAPSILVAHNYVLFEDYDRESNIFKATLEEVKKQYDEARTIAAKDMSPLNRNYMDISTRYIRLFGAMGIINVGAESELEQRCLKDSVDDAVLACRSAFTNGYVIGMNLATIGAALDTTVDPEMSSLDHKVANLIAKVFYNVTFQVMKNKYPDSHPFRSAVWTAANGTKETAEKIINICITQNIGYDIVEEKFTPWDNPIVINSVKTDVEIIGAMMSIVTYALTSNQMLSVNRKFDKEIGQRMVDENEYHKAWVKERARRFAKGKYKYELEQQKFEHMEDYY